MRNPVNIMLQPRLNASGLRCKCYACGEENYFTADGKTQKICEHYLDVMYRKCDSLSSCFFAQFIDEAGRKLIDGGKNV